MIPQPQQQFLAFEWLHARPAHNAPFTCQSANDRIVFALDAAGNEREFKTNVWDFKEMGLKAN